MSFANAITLAAWTATLSAPQDFEHDVLPRLTRAGCNTGACHGAALGQDGFKLSLLGHDPEADFAAIARQFRGRRVDLREPTESLILQKATATIPHNGGKRLTEDSYRAVLEWIQAGAKPPARTLRLVDVTTKGLSVTANYSDGTTRDVTALALFDSLDDSIAEPDGRVKRAGETSIMVRYGGFVRTVRVGKPFGSSAGFEPANFIDEHVSARLVRLGLPAAPEADDERFRRRLWLDIGGKLPGEGDPFDRESWAAWLSDALGVPVKWGIPYDELAREILTAKGRSPYAPLYGDGAAERVAQRFLGRRIQCAQCHNHPFERFTQRDYYGFAAFFARVENRRGEIVETDRGETLFRRQVVEPAFPGGEKASGDRRAAVADWIVKQPDFARAIVNRLWAHFFGRGLVDPVDDLRESNPPSNPELLDALARDLAEHGYDLEHTIRTIVASNAYRRNGEPRVPPPRTLRAMLRRATGADVEVPARMSLEQVLALLNDVPTDGAPADLDALFERTLSRPPTDEERRRCEGERPEDALWALINSKEFYFIR